MAIVQTKTELCNIAYSRYLKQKQTLSDIDTGTSSAEIIFRQSYDSVRREILRKTMPSFAKTRKSLSLMNISPEFGYSYAYEYPSDCLRLIGVDEIHLNKENYAKENIDGKLAIITDLNYDNSLPIRYISDVEDLTLWDDDSLDLFALFLAEACSALVQNNTIVDRIMAQKNSALMSVTANDSQENKPMRVSTSRIQPRRPAYNKTQKR